MPGYGDYGMPKQGSTYSAAPAKNPIPAAGAQPAGIGGLSNLMPRSGVGPAHSKFLEEWNRNIDDGGNTDLGKVKVDKQFVTKDQTGPGLASVKGGYAAEIFFRAKELNGEGNLGYADVRGEGDSDKATAATRMFVEAYEAGDPMAQAAWSFSNRRYNGINYGDKDKFSEALKKQGFTAEAEAAKKLQNNTVGFGALAALAIGNGFQVSRGNDVGIVEDDNYKHNDAKFKDQMAPTMDTLKSVLAGDYDAYVTAQANGGGGGGEMKNDKAKKAEGAKPPEAAKGPAKVEANKEGETKVDTPKADAAEAKPAGGLGGLEQILTLLVQLLTQLLDGKGETAGAYGAEPKKDTAAAEQKANNYLNAYDSKGGVGAGAKPMAAAKPAAAGGGGY